MRRPIFRILAAAALLALVNAAVAGEPAPAKLGIVLSLEGGEEQGRGRLAMHIVNDGPGPAVIMTGLLQPSTRMSDGGDGKILIVFRSAPERFHEERRVVWSDMELRPVRLFAREEVMLPDIAPLLTQLPEGKITIAAVYEIDPGLAKRYGLWSGRIESNSIEITVSRQPER